MGAKNIPVYTMPRMTNFINNNGPWNQLITKNNIQIDTITDESVINISDQISIIPFSVPHRDEFSETVGYQIKGPNNSILFIPDIDKWNLWDKKYYYRSEFKHYFTFRWYFIMEMNYQKEI